MRHRLNHHHRDARIRACVAVLLVLGLISFYDGALLRHHQHPLDKSLHRLCILTTQTENRHHHPSRIIVTSYQWCHRDHVLKCSGKRDVVTIIVSTPPRHRQAASTSPFVYIFTIPTNCVAISMLKSSRHQQAASTLATFLHSCDDVHCGYNILFPSTLRSCAPSTSLTCRFAQASFIGVTLEAPPLLPFILRAGVPHVYFSATVITTSFPQSTPP